MVCPARRERKYMTEGPETQCWDVTNYIYFVTLLK